MLDVIVDAAIDAAADEKSDIRPWSPDLASLSLVNKAFRQNVMEHKVIDTVLLKSPRHLAKIEKQLTAEGKGYIRRVTSIVRRALSLTVYNNGMY